MSDAGSTTDNAGRWAELRVALRSFFARNVASEELAEDLTQECLLKASRSIGQLKETDRVAGWLFQIARRVLIDERRRRQVDVARDASVDQLIEEDSEEGENLTAVVAGWAAEAIDQLAPLDREVVWLAEREGLPLQRIAERTGKSLTAIKSRVRRGRQKVRDALLECCRIEFDRTGSVVGYERRADTDGCCDGEPSSR